MRKTILAVLAVAALATTAFLVAPTARSQGAPPPGERQERRVMTLDGRGSAIGASIRDLAAGEVARAGLERGGGVLIEEVNDEGPASRAGLRAGDVITEFDGERVRSARHFTRLVHETADGRTVTATVVRDASRQTVEITPERRGRRFAGEFVLPDMDELGREIERGMRSLPRDFALDFTWDGDPPHVAVWPRGRLGVQLAPLTDQLAAYFGAEQGVLVSSVTADSPAAVAGLKAGDVITAVNGRAVESPRDVTRELRGERGREVEITVLREKSAVTLRVSRE